MRSNTCGKYFEDWTICYSDGEPKGQCANCGDKWFNHDPLLFPEDERAGVESIYQYQQSLLKKND